MKSQIMIAVLFLLITGCNDFLSVSVQDEVHPQTVDDLESLLLGEAYPHNKYQKIDLLTDDMQCNPMSPNREGGQIEELNQWEPYYCWSWNPVEMQSFGLWEFYYKKIIGCNVVLDLLSEVSGEEKQKAFLKGQSLTLRAYYYFLLVNYFGLPYNHGNPEKNLGIPLKLNSGVRDEYFTRNTVQEVYERIEQDLLEGNRLMSENKMPVSTYEVSDLMAKALLSRMYLYIEKYDDAIHWANEVLFEKPELLSLKNLSWAQGEINYDKKIEGVYSTNISPEIIWVHEGNSDQYITWSGLYPVYTVSNSLLDIFEEKDGKTIDLRKNIFRRHSTKEGGKLSYICRSTDNYQLGIRTAEIYLNRAEAYIHQYKKTGKEEFKTNALEDLNNLRRSRYDTHSFPYKEVSHEKIEDLEEFCKQERRRELCFEEFHRWFDLRRYGMPQIKHTFIGSSNVEQSVILKEQSPRYVLPIPEIVLDANPRLQQNQQ
jgi:hypothetical protein